MIDIEKETLANTDFRRVIWTGNHTQIVLMSLLPNETIDREIHPYVDQFFRVEEGVIMVQIEGLSDRV